MSQRVEWFSAQNVGVEVVAPGIEVGEVASVFPALLLGQDDNVVAIEGSFGQIRDVLLAVINEVEQANKRWVNDVLLAAINEVEQANKRWVNREWS